MKPTGSKICKNFDTIIHRLGNEENADLAEGTSKHEIPFMVMIEIIST